jgi:predicted HTH domain antitoxin
MATTTLELELPDTAFSALRVAPAEFGSALLVAAAAKWYELGLVSQGKAAEIAGLSRAKFITELSRLGVSPIQESADEMAASLIRAQV